ncbi:MAG: dihydroorotate dehydrogenase-like protein [Chloroflexi bacterium]|nr:dihydroorotate dehydrogenase-like protein [Chloroflexota bacterium]
MTNLKTTYLGMQLRSPLVMSASPLSEHVDNIKRAEDAGIGAVVLYSLFEEQLRMERQALYHYLTHGSESYAEALTYYPQLGEFKTDSSGYLEHIRKAKEAVHIPIIASLNGTTVGNWIKFAKQIESAGADALELNEYSIPTDMNKSGAEIEETVIEVLRAVKSAVSIPVAIKLSPFYSNMAYMAKRLDSVGADGLVLFNRFYQPDIDLETLEVKPSVILSTPQALRLPMRWIAILYGRIKASLAATSGVHTAADVAKMLLVGANVTMMTAALLKNGIDHARVVEEGLRQWMTEHEYESVNQMRGAISQLNTEDPAAFERAQYMKALTHYRPDMS